MLCIVFFPTRKEYPKDANDSPVARYLKQVFFFSDSQKCKEKWHNLRSNYMRERRKSKGKTSGSGATLKGKWPYYDTMNFLEYYLQRRNTTGNVPQTAAASVSSADTEKIEIDDSELNGETTSQDQSMEGGSNKDEEPQGTKRGKNKN
jgi:hypothetical protein